MPRGDTFPSLVAVMERLLGPDGCPWDREQTFDSLKSYLLEEAHEVIEAIDSGDARHHLEELGDLLFQVVFQAELARAKERFEVDEVIAAIRDKLVRRHPHIFGDAQVDDAAEQVRVWERIKAAERAEKGQRAGALDGVPRALPALQRAWRLGEKAGAVGFDWAAAGPVMDKVREELAELQEAPDRAATAREMGDLLFALAQLSRHLGFDPEDALRRANDRFRERFEYVEDRLREDGSAPARAGMERMEALWQAAKAALPQK
jgi:nucleoside triphosphate diphosphatase